MRRLDLYFLLLATISLLVGVCMGIGMGIAHDFQFAPVHAHLNLLGWTSLALFGLAYRVYPALGASWIAGVHFTLACLGAVLFPLGIALSIMDVTIAVAIVASFVWLAGVAMFLVNLARITFLGSQSLSLAPAE
jgi:hypothetical protein